MSPVLVGHELRKSYGLTPALRGASIAVDEGEIVAVMGPSGSGKSTLLHCLVRRADSRRGRGALRRPAHRPAPRPAPGAAAAHRLRPGVPVRAVGAGTARGREHRAAAAARRAAPTRVPGARRRTWLTRHGSGRAGRPTAGRAVRRAGPAGRPGAGAGRAAEGRLRRRADRFARLGRRRRGDGAARRHGEGAGHRRARGDARAARGRLRRPYGPDARRRRVGAGEWSPGKAAPAGDSLRVSAGAAEPSADTISWRRSGGREAE